MQTLVPYLIRSLKALSAILARPTTRTLLPGLLVTSLTPSAVSSQGLETIQRAQELGTVLAAEQFCGLAYDQVAVGAWIDANVDPTDMQFAPMLQAMTGGASYILDNMTESQKTAHCRAVSQSARSAGFIE